MAESTRDSTSMQFLRPAADRKQVVNVNITTSRKSKSKKPTGQSGAFAALDRLYVENSEALRRLADG